MWRGSLLETELRQVFQGEGKCNPDTHFAAPIVIGGHAKTGHPAAEVPMNEILLYLELTQSGFVLFIYAESPIFVQPQVTPEGDCIAISLIGIVVEVAIADLDVDAWVDRPVQVGVHIPEVVPRVENR